MSDFRVLQFPLKLPELQTNNVVAAFNEYFEVIDADSPELLREAFHLRYRALCIEQRLPGFDAKHYLDEHEYDNYDAHSSHILLQHRPSGDFVGTARLILPASGNYKKLFPIEKHTQLDPALLDIRELPRQRIAEVSRLIIVRRFLRRKSDNGKFGSELPLEGSETKKPRRFPHPILALAVGLVRRSAEHNITHWLSIMDPALNRLLGLYGLQHEPIGPISEHHGARRPYYVNLPSMLDRMYQNHNNIWQLLTDYGKIRPGCEEHARAYASIPTLLAKY